MTDVLWLGLVVFALFLISMIVVVLKTEQLNIDPLQENLSPAVLRLAERNLTPDARREFTDVAASYLYLAHVEDPAQVKIRLHHALSMNMRRISKAQLTSTERYLAEWKLPPRHAAGATRGALDHAESADIGPVDVFVSYAREDLDAARLLVSRLRASGLRVWWDDRIATGSRWDETIKHELDAARVVLVLWSPFASVSEWVRTEAALAKTLGKLIPVFIRKCRLPEEFSELQTADLSKWGGEPTSGEWSKVLAAISAPPNGASHATPRN